MADLFTLYESKARKELGELTRRLKSCHAGAANPVPGRGNPLADIFLVKASPDAGEEETGEAFSGRAGEAIDKSAERLGFSPSALYLTNLMKCAASRDTKCAEACGRLLIEELLIVQPRIVLAMGKSVYGALRDLYDVSVPYHPGLVERVPGGPVLIFTVGFPAAMTEEEAKKALWRDLQSLGREYARAF